MTASGNLLIITLSAFWLGLLFGVSYLATLAKFQVADLSRPVALQVGRVTFQKLHRAECVLGLLLLLPLVILTDFDASWAFPLASFALGLLAIQLLWLKPALDRRVEQIVAGSTVSFGFHHALFMYLEALKIFALFGLIALTAISALSSGA